ncbi:MAG: glutamate 5-kinase [Gammaproteobacteria bacterium]|jgi:glutamate 5-kinase
MHSVIESNIVSFNKIIQSKPRVVVKVGSSLLANGDNLTPRYAFIHGLLSDIAMLHDKGYEVVLTSSGSVALGLNCINSTPETASIKDKQAAAACGQPILMHAYKQVALEYGFDIAQVLVTVDDLENMKRFLNTKNTINKLLSRGVMPIVNENDTVTTQELRVGDNDRLAARVSQMVQAENLTILTCVDGLYDREPSLPGAKLVPALDNVSEYLEVASGTSFLGSGGMLTKLQAANMAQNAGCTTYIARGTLEAPVSSLLLGKARGTLCKAHTSPASFWRVWLTDRLQMAGSLIIRQEAADALVEGKTSISCYDVVSTHSSFQKADVLHIYDEKGIERARGLCNFSSDELAIIAKHPDAKVEDLLGYRASPKLISAENWAQLAIRHIPWKQPEREVRQDTIQPDVLFE